MLLLNIVWACRLVALVQCAGALWSMYLELERRRASHKLARVDTDMQLWKNICAGTMAVPVAQRVVVRGALLDVEMHECLYRRTVTTEVQAEPKLDRLTGMTVQPRVLDDAVSYCAGVTLETADTPCSTLPLGMSGRDAYQQLAGSATVQVNTEQPGTSVTSTFVLPAQTRVVATVFVTTDAGGAPRVAWSFPRKLVSEAQFASQMCELRKAAAAMGRNANEQLVMWLKATLWPLALLLLFVLV